MSKMFEPSQVYKPFVYDWAMELFDESERMHWTHEEPKLAPDVNDWKLGKLTPVERDFVTQILRMFTQADLRVGEFYDDKLLPIFQNKEIRAMLKSFSCREEIHKRAYGLLNDTLGLPEGEYSAFMTYKEMADKDAFMCDADTSTMPGLARALAKAVFNEGVSLFASFAMLLNFNRRGLMMGMGTVVEWSIKDETKHVIGVARLFHELCKDHPEIVTDALKADIYQMARDCVVLEDCFIDLAFAMGPVEGITPDAVKQYIRFVADRRLTQLGLKENWAIEKNPLAWIDHLIVAPDHTNFFEKKSTEYEIGSLSGGWDYSMADYRVYGKDGCPYCEQAKRLLELNEVVFDYVDLSDDDARQVFYNEGGFEGAARSVPKIYRLGEFGPELVGGYAELAVRFSKK